MKKTLPSIIAVLLIFVFTNFVPGGSKAETLNGKYTITDGMSAEFGFFRVHRQARSAVLTWGLNSESGIMSFIIERSYDGDFFDPVSAAVPTHARSYSWKDAGVFPGIIYYRIICVMADNTMSSSSVQAVKIVAH